MNGLSLLLYFIGLVDNIHGLFTFLLWMSGLGLAVFAVFGAMVYIDSSSTERVEVVNTVRYFAFRLGIVFSISAFLTTVVPDRKTMTMIAASEVSQRVIETKAVQNMGEKLVDPTIDLLNAYIEKQAQEVRKEIEAAKAKK